MDANPVPYGAATVLGSHSCVALSPVAVPALYLPAAQSDKLNPSPGQKVGITNHAPVERSFMEAYESSFFLHQPFCSQKERFTDVPRPGTSLGVLVSIQRAMKRPLQVYADAGDR